MKRKTNYINTIMISNFLLLLIPLYIEKFIYINEGINYFRFVFVLIIQLILIFFLNKNKINIFALFKKYTRCFLYLFISFVLIYSICYTIGFYKNNKNIELYGNSVSDAITGPLYTSNYDIIFSNVELKEIPTSFCVTMSNYGKEIVNAHYSFSLLYNDSIIKNYYVDVSTVKDHDNICLDLSDVNININNIKQYHINVAPIDVTVDNSITLFKNSKTNEITMYFYKSESIEPVKLLLIVIYIIISIVLLIYIFITKDLQVEKLYLIVSVIYTLIMIVIVPPYQIPDEKYHFYNTIQQSQIKSINISDHYSNGIIEVPNNIHCLNYSSESNGNKVDNYSDIIDCFHQENNVDIRMDERMISSSGKLGYIFTVIGVKIADLFSNSPLLIFLCGRFFNYLISVVIIYFILKKTPKHKELFLLVSLMPMFIQQMISYSYDSILNTICLLLLALSFILDEERLNNRLLFIIYTIIGILIINIKVVYLPLFIFAFFVNYKRYGTLKSKICYIVGVMLLSFGVSSFISFYSNLNFIARAPVTNGGNLQFIIDNPMLVLRVAKNTIDKFGVYYLNGLVGYFGWFSYRFSDIYIWFYLIIFIYVVSNSCDSRLTLLKRIFTFIVCLIMISGIFFALFLNDELNYGLNYILGVQGRYFLPIIIPLCYVFIPKTNNKKIDKRIVYSYITIVLLVYVLLTIMYYY